MPTVATTFSRPPLLDVLFSLVAVEGSPFWQPVKSTSKVSKNRCKNDEFRFAMRHATASALSSHFCITPASFFLRYRM
jgi:hypothetical protein